MRRLAVIALLFVLVSACGHKDKGFMPERLLSQAEMIDILSDVQIIEADINYLKTKDRDAEEMPKDYKELTRSYYDQLFEHYGITDSIYSQNIRYYTERPDQLEVIMDSVMQRFVRLQSGMKNEGGE
jgi:hypothetical protein